VTKKSSARVGRLDELTFRGNVGSTRHGLLRLTPAYSVRLVRDLLTEESPGGAVLDPFCGTGTTVLACAELGIDCTTIDLNPFLVWFARAKIARYSASDIAGSEDLVSRMIRAASARSGDVVVPPIHRIDRWWDPGVLSALGRAHSAARRFEISVSEKSRDLASVAFCRTIIECANVSFGHQSMSFRKRENGSARRNANGHAGARVSRSLERAHSFVVDAMVPGLPTARARVLPGDSRNVHGVVGKERFARVVTSPPYPNRMSYVRELRPYMYWLGYLAERKDAGELDWRAIGGTWGAATSRLGRWRRDAVVAVPFAGFDKVVTRIERHEPLLARYVERYFEDMTHHTRSLRRVIAPGGRVQYVVGNSKFYDVLLPAQEIFAALFEHAGFGRTKIHVLRKRTSKRELFEYLVEAELPRGRLLRG
jgi:SAM-dependent methyltransferase